MSYYNWETIFKQKSDEELVDIFKGNSFLGFESEIYAFLELESRTIQIDNLKDYINIKIEKLKQNILEYDNSKFINSKYFRSLIFNAIGVITVISIIMQNRGEFINDRNVNHINIFYYIVVGVIGSFSGYINYFLYKRDLKKTIKIKKELLKKLLIPMKA